jgi:mRNA-degrading endonuclease RelE of RelBE toxin-antitoxin system
VYALDFDPPAAKQRDTLPAEALAAFMEARALLEIAPWSGMRPSSNPSGNMLSLSFGEYGIVTYFVLEERLLVYIVRITWL